MLFMFFMCAFGRMVLVCHSAAPDAARCSLIEVYVPIEATAVIRRVASDCTKTITRVCSRFHV
jgi:hypothetical protein